MGTYPINCVKCGKPFVWFSGTMDQRCEKCKISIKEHVRGNVTFKFYRQGHLYYETETKLVFPVPVVDCGEATFLDTDKAILFMRYIRKYLEEIGT